MDGGHKNHDLNIEIEIHHPHQWAIGLDAIYCIRHVCICTCICVCLCVDVFVSVVVYLSVSVKHSWVWERCNTKIENELSFRADDQKHERELTHATHKRQRFTWLISCERGHKHPDSWVSQPWPKQPTHHSASRRNQAALNRVTHWLSSAPKVHWFFLF